MPTVGWILEDSVARFWEGSVKREPPRTQAFTCGQCGAPFRRVEELRSHYAAVHPIRLPILHVRGLPLLRESVIRTALTSNDIAVLEAKQCFVRIDGGPWVTIPIAEMRTRFASTVDATWNIRLLNERLADGSHVEEQYHVRFRIPGQAALDEIDENFIEILARNDLSHADLQRFEATLGGDGPEREYGAALGDYALGVLLKEWQTAPKSQVRFHDFASKMKLALSVLEQFDRPVALAVVGAIRFSLNDFRDYGVRTAAELSVGLDFLGTLLSGRPSTIRLRVSPRTTAVCPVDRVSAQLLRTCIELSTGEPLSAEDFHKTEQVTARRAPTSEQDLVKANVLCAESSIRCGNRPRAIRHLRAVQFDATSRGWAQAQLDLLEE